MQNYTLPYSETHTQQTRGNGFWVQTAVSVCVQVNVTFLGLKPVTVLPFSSFAGMKPVTFKSLEILPQPFSKVLLYRSCFLFGFSPINLPIETPCWIYTDTKCNKPQQREELKLC